MTLITHAKRINVSNVKKETKKKENINPAQGRIKSLVFMSNFIYNPYS